MLYLHESLFESKSVCSRPQYDCQQFPPGLSRTCSVVHRVVRKHGLSQCIAPWTRQLKKKQLDMMIVTSALCLKLKPGAGGLAGAQVVPCCHHFLWVSHCVLPLLHSLWGGAVKAQLDLKQTDRWPSFLSLSQLKKPLFGFKVFWWFR